MVLAWRNHPKVRSFMFTQHEIQPAEHREWFAQAAEDPSKQLLIVEREGQPFGYAQFSNLSSNRVAEWGFYVSPHAVPGSGLRLGIAAINHAFNHLGLYEIRGIVMKANHASINFHHRLGFISDGTTSMQPPESPDPFTCITFILPKEKWDSEKISN